MLTDGVTRSVVFERKQLDALERIAQRRGVSISDLVRVAVSGYLKRQKGKT